ncbi:hypothetical protein [Streptomyces sp. TS71-3]|uniref:hypothetical protein n=1 Tax=Streptomyces sp. TS71-3 TaxID=2733862 RepID=UPI001B06CCD8|nr:hypothetical protein [Streptomyces sp. TS71-3]GHJ36848.1 hypothetical protein Sm713_24570 [Streptomyces sp. TS71-3]
MPDRMPDRMPDPMPDPMPNLSGRRLAVIERAYRGAIETQFADVLYLVRELNRQLGGLDLLLRGLAVTYAVEAAPVPAVRVGGGELDTLPDPRRSMATLLDEGVGVRVDARDLAALDPAGSSRLMPGAELIDGSRAALLWPQYAEVLYL